MSFHNPGNPLPGQSLSQGVLLADYCVGQMRGQRGGGGTDAEEERQGLCGARNSRLWIRCGGRSLRDWHRLFFSISAFENGIKGQVRMSIKNL